MRASLAAVSESRRRLTPRRLGALLALAGVALPYSARAQQQAPPPSIRGVVTDTAGRPLDDAEVGSQPYATVRTDAAGRFVLPPRAYTFPLSLAVRRVGFAARSVTVAAADTALRIVLRSTGQVLDTLVVVDTRSPALVANGFYDRQRKSNGRHLDSLALLGYASSGLVGVLRETNRVAIQRDRTDDHAYTRVSGRQCRMNVFVDGRFERAAQPGPRGENSVGLRDIVPFDAILAVEVYPSIGSVPSQFQRVGTAAGDPIRRGMGQIPSPVRGAPPRSAESGDAACGAIVIWTKRVEGREPDPGASR